MGLLSEFEETSFTFWGLIKALFTKTKKTVRVLHKTRFNGFVGLIICLHLGLFFFSNINWYYFVDSAVGFFHYMMLTNLAAYIFLFGLFFLFLIAVVRLLKSDISLKYLFSLGVYSSLPLLCWNVITEVIKPISTTVLKDIIDFSREQAALRFVIHMACFYLLYQTLVPIVCNKEKLFLLLFLAALSSVMIVYLFFSVFELSQYLV